jgi:intracellular septation protein
MDQAKRKPSGWLNLLVDYGPILVFFVVYKWFAPAEQSPGSEILAVVRSTGAFIVAAVIALAFSKWKLGRISPMLWLSTALIVGFGALTIWLRDERFIQIKPTVIYAMFATALLIGWYRGKALLQVLLEAAFEGLDQAGWLKLSRNWGLFFVVLAGLNEVLRAQLSFGDWLWAKLWVFMPLSFLFTFSQIPMLMRHGLGAEALPEEETKLPPP